MTLENPYSIYGIIYKCKNAYYSKQLCLCARLLERSKQSKYINAFNLYNPYEVGTMIFTFF